MKSAKILQKVQQYAPEGSFCAKILQKVQHFTSSPHEIKVPARRESKYLTQFRPHPSA
jgi:hypothetical protein